MAFKLLIDIDEAGNIDVSHEGQIEPIIILGAIRKIEHSLLMTLDAMEAQSILESMGGSDESGDSQESADGGS